MNMTPEDSDYDYYALAVYNDKAQQEIQKR